MMIVLDTNVIVSGILRPSGKAALILTLVADGTLQLAFDLRLLSQYRNVLNRPKFSLAKENVEAFLTQVEQEGFLVSVKPLKTHLLDPDDELFLEVAIAGRAEAIVTGYKRRLSRKEYEGVRILSPVEFVEVLEGRI